MRSTSRGRCCAAVPPCAPASVHSSVLAIRVAGTRWFVPVARPPRRVSEGGPSGAHRVDRLSPSPRTIVATFPPLPEECQDPRQSAGWGCLLPPLTRSGFAIPTPVPWTVLGPSRSELLWFPDRG